MGQTKYLITDQLKTQKIKPIIFFLHKKDLNMRLKVTVLALNINLKEFHH